MRIWQLIVVIVILATVAAALYVVVIGSGPSDRDQILGMIADAQQGINQRVFSRALKYVADDYHDSEGNTKASLKRLALQAARSSEQYHLSTMVRGLVISGGGKRATVMVEATVRYLSSGETKTYNVTLKLEKRGRRWLVVNADGWQQAVDDAMGGEMQ